MKRSHQVTLVLLGSTALAAWHYSQATPPSLEPQQVMANPAQTGCDRNSDTPSPGCGDARLPAQDPTSRSTATPSFGGHGGFLGFFHGGASSGSSEGRASTSTTTFGGFGGSGRAAAAHSAGG